MSRQPEGKNTHTHTHTTKALGISPLRPNSFLRQLFWRVVSAGRVRSGEQQRPAEGRGVGGVAGGQEVRGEARRCAGRDPGGRGKGGGWYLGAPGAERHGPRKTWSFLRGAISNSFSWCLFFPFFSGRVSPESQATKKGCLFSHGHWASERKLENIEGT